MRFLLTVILFSLASVVQAEHEVDHRYQIHGYLLDENDRGIANQDVIAFDGNSPIARGKTDSSGYYSLHLHLHNEDNGRRLRLRAGSNQAELRVRFEPDDLTTLRVHDANFVAGKFVEGDLGRFRVPGWVYPLVGILIIGMCLVWLEKRRRRKILQRKLASAGGASSGSGKTKKKRKKKR